MKKENIQEKLLSKSKNSQLEKFGKTITFFCIAVIVFVVAMIFFFVAQKGSQPFLLTRLIHSNSCLGRLGIRQSLVLMVNL